MKENYWHVAGPVYLFSKLDGEVEHTDTANNFDEQWVSEVIDGLDMAGQQLSEFVKKNAGSFIGVRLFRNGQWFGVFNLMANGSFVEKHKPAIRKFVEACIKAARVIDDAIWCDYESNLGQTEACWLACRSVEDVPLFIMFLETCDLDHETDHAGDIFDVVETHGWTNETMALWVARVGNCRGQWGHEEGWFGEPYLAEWVMQDSRRQELLTQLIAGNLIAMHTWELRNHKHRALESISALEYCFSTPEHGLGDIAGELTRDASKLAKSIALRYLDEGMEPKHWLYALPDY